MQRVTPILLALFVVVAVASSAARAELLANPGFEQPVTTDGPPFVGSWEAFNGGTGATAVNASTNPHSGTQHLALAIDHTDNTFAGVFQDVPNLTPGTNVVFSGWNMTPSNPLDGTVEIRIEWRNSVAGTEVTRTANLNPTLTDQYTQFSLPSIVPPGADTARVVYAFQTFSGGPTNNGTVFVDDVSFVPEPSAAMLLCLSALGATARRRRR